MKDNPNRFEIQAAKAVRAVFIEGLESRRLLSAALDSFGGTVFRPDTDHSPSIESVGGQGTQVIDGQTVQSAFTNYSVVRQSTSTPFATSSPNGYSPSDIRHAYGIDAIAFGAVVGDGAGQTIAIVDAYDNPKFVSSNLAGYATSDLYYFNQQYGLPQFGTAGGPTFTKLDQTGGTNYPSADASWAAEIALDVEWVHALAPKANIVLVEANNANLYMSDGYFVSDTLLTAVNYARSIPDVSVVSMSYGNYEYDFETTAEDPIYTTPSGHTGVTFLAATGDYGVPADYPAMSPNVVAVGGTELTVSGGSYGSETGWSSGGGGISDIESQPTYQNGVVTQSSTQRTTPDVSFHANTSAGVSVYDSYNNGSTTPWFNLAGTSFSTPAWASLIAIANQGRALNSLGTLDGPSQTLPQLYALPSSNFHDITTGNNGYAAGTGYDLVTGLGTPVANTLVGSLAGASSNTGTYTGTLFQDNNGDTAYDGTDVPLAGQTVYNDANDNGMLDAGETSAVTDGAGVYSLSLATGLALHLRAITPAGYFATGTAVVNGTTSAGTITNNFGYFPGTFNLPAGANDVTLQLNAAGTTFQIFVNTPTTAAPTYEVATSVASGFTFNGNDDDSFTLDLTHGSPAGGFNVSFNGGESAGDRINVIGAPAGSTASFDTTGIQADSFSLVYTGVETFAYTGGVGNDNVTFSHSVSPAFIGGGGNDSIAISDGNYAPAGDLGADGTAVSLGATNSALSFATSQHLAALSLGSNSTAVLSGVAHLIRTGGLTIDSTSSLDLTSNALILDYTGTSPKDTLLGLLTTGYAASAWTGLGVRSSSAAADGYYRHTLGVAEASDVLDFTSAPTASYLGETVDATTLLVRYTIYGDANLDAKVDFNDYLIVQAHNGSSATTYGLGNFNYDSAVDFNDYMLLQVNFGLSA